MWGVPDGDKLLIITDDGSWKTKRIHNTPRVTIAEVRCARQAQGRTGRGGGPDAAEVRDAARVRRRDQAVLVARVVVRPARADLRGGIDKVHAAIEIASDRRRRALGNPRRPPGRWLIMAMRLFLLYVVVEMAVIVALAYDDRLRLDGAAAGGARSRSASRWPAPRCAVRSGDCSAAA